MIDLPADPEDRDATKEAVAAGLRERLLRRIADQCAPIGASGEIIATLPPLPHWRFTAVNDITWSITGPISMYYNQGDEL